MKKLKYYFALVLSMLLLLSAGVYVTYNAVKATTATTYTMTYNADGINVRCQDAYLPEATYDRIGLAMPQDMVIDTVIEDGKEVEYAYVLNLNSGSNDGPFIIKFRLDKITNDETYITKYVLKNHLKYVSEPTGLWLTTTTVNGITRKELYIADKSAKYTQIIKATEEEKELNLLDYTHTYNGLVYRIPFNGDNLDFEHYDFIHEPTAEAPRDDYDLYELVSANDEKEFNKYQVIPTKDKSFTSEVTRTDDTKEYYRIVCKVEGTCPERIVPLGQYLMKTPSFGQDTLFAPNNVAVDKAGNIFITSIGTTAGMIQMSYTGEFISFFVVNTVKYNFLYQFIKNYGTKEQLKLLQVDNPPQFYNLFIDNSDLVYSLSQSGSVIFDKYSTNGSSILNNKLTVGGDTLSDSYVTKDGIIFLSTTGGGIIALEPTGSYVFYFGFGSEASENILGFFETLPALVVDNNKRIWAIDSANNYLQTFTPTEYANKIFNAIIAFNNHDYEGSRKAWEEVLAYDSLSVLANDGLGKAFYYDHDFAHSLNYFKTSKNRELYSNVFWELRNDFLQEHLGLIFGILLGLIVVIVGLNILFAKNKKLNQKRKDFKEKIREKRWFKDLTVGFRMIKKPNDTFYELKTHKRGSVIGATIYYVLAIVAIILNRYGKALPFQLISINTSNPTTFLVGVIAVIAIFILCNYLVSAINDGEGKFLDIYKFTGYSLLPIIICLPIRVGISYGLTLNEEVVLSILQMIAFWGSGIFLVIGILETHNYTFGKTVKNILLTIIFMILFLIICAVVIVMMDQMKSFIETIWKEVKLRAGWY